MPALSAVYDESIELTPSTFTRYGYVFNGWNTMPNGGGDAYTDAQSVQNLAGKINGDRVTLYAQWKPIEYKIAFHANNPLASGQMEMQTVAYNSNVELTACAFSLADMEFAGWATTEDGPVRYKDGASVYNLSGTADEVVNLYAVWRTPLAEIQKPYLNELETAFTQYNPENYTSQDWKALSDAYAEAQTKIQETDNEDYMRTYCNQGKSKMAAIVDKEARKNEMVSGWQTKHAEILAMLDGGKLDESNAVFASEAALSALNDLNLDGMKQFSELSDEGDLQQIGGEAIEELRTTAGILLELRDAAVWLSDLQGLSQRPFSEIASTDYEKYYTACEGYNALSSEVQAHINAAVEEKLETGRELAKNKRSAVAELEAFYLDFDLENYSEQGKKSLQQALQKGIVNVEKAESVDAVQTALLNGRNAMNNVPDKDSEPPAGGGGTGGGGTGGGDTDGEDSDDEENNNGSYIDIDEKAWYYNAVYFVSEKGYFRGMGQNMFMPEVYMTRAMAVTVLYRAAGEPYAGTEISLPFTDVESGSWYAEAVCWAYDQGIIEGNGAGLFEPMQEVTREQLAAMLYRYAGSPETQGDLTGFADTDEVSAYAEKAMRWTVENGIIQGMGDGTLAPKALATRAQVAQIMLNLEGIK